MHTQEALLFRQAILDAFKEKIDTELLRCGESAETSERHRQRIQKTVRSHKIRKKRLLVAAIVAIALVLGCIVTVAADPSIRNWIYEVTKLPRGGQLYDAENDITYFHSNITATYSSFEELAKSENLGILYPTVLPEGVTVKNIYSIDDESMFEYRIQFSSALYSIDIYEPCPEVIDDLDGEIMVFNGITYELVSVQSEEYAFCTFNGHRYSFRAPDRESLIYILENVKGQ